MPGGREKFVKKLEETSEQIGQTSRTDVAIMLRRAALRIRNADGIVLEPEVADKLSDVAAKTGISRHELASLVVRDWLVANGYLPFHDLDEDEEVNGSA